MATDKWEETKRTTSVTTCQPAVRMVLAVAGVGSGGEGWHYIMPVVALRTTVVRTYARLASGRGRWFFDDECTRTVAVVLEEGMPTDHTDVAEYIEADNVVRLLPAPWPAEEDETRFADVIADMQKVARHKVARRAEEVTS